MLFHGKKGSIPATKKLWVIIGGESNSGGLAFNSQLPSELLLPSNVVSIWDNNANNGWLPLQIGVNNLIGHASLSNVGFSTTRHGLERSLLENAYKQFYVTKTGQGGSRISQWLPADVSGYYNTFVSRVNNGITALGAVSYTPVYVWWQGVNDALDGNTSTQWAVDTQAHFARVRSILGANTRIFVLTVMNNSANKILINTRIASLAGPLTTVVDVSSADNYVQSDTNHWDTTGFNIAGSLLVQRINTTLGLNSPFLQ